MRRLSLIDDESNKRPSQPPGPSATRERVAVPWVALVPVDEAGTLAFATFILQGLRERGVDATVLLEAPRFEGALLETDARAPDGLTLHGARLLRVLCSEDNAREAWVRALSTGNGPYVVVGTEALGQVIPTLTVAVTGGKPMGLSAPRFRQVRTLVDAELDAPRPAFATWLAGRLAQTSAG